MIDPELYAAIRQGCADMLWWMAWADGMEEVGRSNELSGAEISQIAPATPAVFVGFAERILSTIERRAYLGGPLSIEEALVAVSDDPDGDAQEFGESIAHEAEGTGVSWSDDHEPHHLPTKIYTECHLAVLPVDEEGEPGYNERLLDDGDVAEGNVYFSVGE